MTSFDEMPIDLMKAISYANRIIDWHENMIEDEIPPEWMWPFDEEVGKWFDELKAERKREHGNNDNLTEVPMMDNELAAGRGR